MKNDDNNIGMVILGGVVATISVAVGVAVVLLYYSWALAIVWNWLAVPIFALPTLTTASAFGMMVVLGALKGIKGKNKTKPDATAWTVLLINPLVSISLAWIAKQFI